MELTSQQNNYYIPLIGTIYKSIPENILNNLMHPTCHILYPLRQNSHIITSGLNDKQATLLPIQSTVEYMIIQNRSYQHPVPVQNGDGGA
jgi:hypothetical protein